MLKEGDKAPAFDLESDEGGRVSLKDFSNRTLVLYFYPRDNTPGCTRQAQAFTASKKAIEAAGASVVGVSRDSLKSHTSFRDKCGLGITLLSDPDLGVHRAYGAWGMKKMYGRDVEGVLRTTFVIDRGKVTKVFPNVKVDGHADAVLQVLTKTTKDEVPMAAKKKSSGKKRTKKSTAAALGEAAGALVAKAVGKVAAATAPKAKKAKAAAKKKAGKLAAKGKAVVEKAAKKARATKKKATTKKKAGAKKK
ncbi:MAG: peroxiredoxin [Labilithrix sp.]|nr:peroxiredoxin [Labilithrix sp.]MCW5814806.1 peroxiredoxin [Labilithrix sp.]